MSENEKADIWKFTWNKLTTIAPKKSDINYQKPKNWLLPLTGESLLVFYYSKKSDITC